MTTRNRPNRAAMLAVLVFSMLAADDVPAIDDNVAPITPANRAGIQPFGSYSGTGPDRVNVFNGNLTIDIPLVDLPGRAGGAFSLRMSYNSKLWFNKPLTILGQELEVVRPIQEYYQYFDTPYLPRIGWVLNLNSQSPAPIADFQVRKLGSVEYYRQLYYIRTAAGARHEARNIQTDRFLEWSDFSTLGNVYRTIDNSHISYDWTGETIRFPDGSSVSASSSGALTDTNGNFVTEVTALDADPAFMNTTYTDTTGRSVRVRYHRHGLISDLDEVDKIVVAEGTPGERTIQFGYQTLHVWTGELGEGGYHGDMNVLSTITLPNGRSYRFEYASKTERPTDPHPSSLYSVAALAKITYPTGGYARYEYGQATGGGGDLNPQVLERIVSADGSPQAEQTFEYRFENETVGTLPNASTSKTTIVRPDGTKEIHRFDLQGYETQSETRTANDTLVVTQKKTYEYEYNDGAGLELNGDLPQNQRLKTQRTIWPTSTQSTIESEVTYEYDRLGYVVGSVTHTTGNVVKKIESEFGIDAPGARLRRTDWTYLHGDDAGYGVSGAHILNRTTHERTYDGADALQAHTQTEYDNSGYLQARSGAFQHDDSNYGVSTTRRGNPVRVKRYRIDNGAEVGAPITAAQSWFDTLGNRLRFQDALGHETQFVYTDSFSDGVSRSSDAYLTEIRAPLAQTGASREVTKLRYYFDSGLVERETDPRNQATTYQYDSMLRVKKVSHPDGGYTRFDYLDGTRQVQTYQARQLGPLEEITTHEDYDGLGRLTRTARVNSVGGEGTEYVDRDYDALGRLKRVSNPYRSGSPLWTTTTYDALGRPIQVSNPDGTTVDTTYDAQVRTVSDEAGKKRTLESDAAGRVIAVTEDPDAKAYRTLYGYDALDNLRVVLQGVDPNDQGGQPRVFGYDSLSRLVVVLSPETGPSGSLGVTQYAYDDAGRLGARIDPRNIPTVYQYDNLDRRILVAYQESPYLTKWQTVNYGTSSATHRLNFGRRLSAASFLPGQANTTTYTYNHDAMGRLIAKDLAIASVPNAPFTARYQYDLAGNVTAVTYPSGRVVQPAYDATNRLRSLASSRIPGGKYLQGMKYHPQGTLSTASYGNGLGFASTYNSRLQTDTLTTGGLAIAFSYTGTQQTANNGNIVTMTVNGANYQYQYDGLNRVTRADGGGQTPAQDYSYDRFGNMIKGVVSEAAMWNPPNYDPAKNRRANGTTYDNAGNLTNDLQRTYVYDAENRIRSIGGAATATYDYTAEGERYLRTASGATRVYVRGLRDEVLTEYLVDNTLTSSRLAAPATDAVVRFHHLDHLGTPRRITDLAGATVSNHNYYPFGDEIPPLPSDGETHKFTGKERDAESTLDYFGARYLHSTHGRFTSVDPSRAGTDPTNPQSWNRYAYGLDNPVIQVDHNGMWPTSVHERIIDNAFPSMSPSARLVLKNASEYVDIDQSAAGAYKHGMKSPGQSQLAAAAQTDQFITDRLTLAAQTQLLAEHQGWVAAGEHHRFALSFFGQALHAATDTTSPLHQTDHVWRGLGPIGWIPGLLHYFGEVAVSLRKDSTKDAESAAIFLWSRYLNSLLTQRKNWTIELEAKKGGRNYPW